VAGYNPDSYPIAGAPRGRLSERKTLKKHGVSRHVVQLLGLCEPGRRSYQWRAADGVAGRRNHRRNQDLMRLGSRSYRIIWWRRSRSRLFVHVLIQPGTGGEAQAMRSIEYDTVSDRYGKYLEEVLADVEKTYKIRHDAYSRAIAGASSGAICAFNAAWYYPDRFSRVLSHIGSYSGIQWRPERNQDGGFISYPTPSGARPKRTCVCGCPTAADDQEANSGSWPPE